MKTVKNVLTLFKKKTVLQVVPQIIFWLNLLQLSILNNKDYVNYVIKTVENVKTNKTIVSHVIYIP